MEQKENAIPSEDKRLIKMNIVNKDCNTWSAALGLTEERVCKLFRQAEAICLLNDDVVQAIDQATREYADPNELALVIFAMGEKSAKRKGPFGDIFSHIIGGQLGKD